GSISRYDGYNPVYLDTTSFSEWADWCDQLVADGTGSTEKRITFNGIFDTANESMWEAAIKVCNMARASLIWNGNIITVVIDKAGTEVQLFTIGNIGIDSFKETFLSTEDRAGSIEVEFTNATNDYEKDVYTLVDSNAGNADNKVSISLIGCTKPSEAWRAAKYRALCNQYLLRSIEFDVDIDAIACSVGDIVRVQHDVPQWGYGGRVVSATTDSVTIDQTVTIAAGSSYEIVVRLSDDTVVERTVTNVAGDHTVLTVSTPFDTTPAQFDVYAFGVVDVSYKPYRIVGMRRKTDLIIGIQAVEYNPNIYTVDSATPALPVSNYSALTPFVSITNLNVFYEIFTNDSESLDVKVTATWSVGTNTIYSGAKVYLRELLADGTYSGWVFKGETKSKDYSINGLKLGTTYEVGVVGINFTGVVTPFSGLVRKAVITNDVPAFYSDSLQRRVTGLQLFNDPNESSFTGKDCKVEWNAMSAIDFNTEAGGTAGSTSPNVWLKDYEVRVYSSGTLRRTEYVLDTFYTYTYDKNYEDGAGVPVASLTIGVLARSKTGKVSLTENKLTVTNPAPSAVTNLTATPVVGGVVFEWDKNVEEDFQCYYIRTKVSTGSYSSWFKITDNKYTRVLTSAEIVLYGTNATIYIEVEALDLFNQASAAASANDEANTVSDNIFQLIGSKTGGTGNVSDLYDGTRTSGGVTF
ncbi:MAG: host specificity factor TipJ family phage tail protein, partial [Methanogenium sp.]